MATDYFCVDHRSYFKRGQDCSICLEVDGRTRRVSRPYTGPINIGMVFGYRGLNRDETVRIDGFSNLKCGGSPEPSSILFTDSVEMHYEETEKQFRERIVDLVRDPTRGRCSTCLDDGHVDLLKQKQALSDSNVELHKKLDAAEKQIEELQTTVSVGGYGHVLGISARLRQKLEAAEAYVRRQGRVLDSVQTDNQKLCAHRDEIQEELVALKKRWAALEGVLRG